MVRDVRDQLLSFVVALKKKKRVADSARTNKRRAGLAHIKNIMQKTTREREIIGGDIADWCLIYQELVAMILYLRACWTVARIGEWLSSAWSMRV